MWPKCIATLLLSIALVRANLHLRKMERQILDATFSHDAYDARIIPSGVNSTIVVGNPLEVFVSVYVGNIFRIDDERMLYNLDIALREEWVDNRLKYTQTSGINFITLDNDDEIWTPDIFFNDYKGSTHDVTKSNVLLRLYPNGTVMLSKRYNLLILCPMDLHNFPFDYQQCRLKMGSWAWPTDLLVLKWKEPIDDAVTLSNEFLPTLFTLADVDATATTSHTKTGNWSVLSIEFTFVRLVNSYLIEVFIPCIMFMILGYLTFWIDVRYFTARIILVLTCLLTETVLISDFNVTQTKTSYTKLIDVFTGLSLTIQFSTVIETIFVHFVESKHKFFVDVEDDDEKDEGKANRHVEVINGYSKLRKIKTWIIENSKVKRMDSLCRVLYPIVVCVFQLIFWSVALYVKY